MNDNHGSVASRSYDINFELVSERKNHILKQLREEGIGRREVIDEETGRERLRDLVWNDCAELSIIDRCQLLQELLHDLAVESKVSL